MTDYIENSTQAEVTAGQTPADPTAIELAAILGLRASGIWIEPGDWLVSYTDGTFVGISAAAFPSSYTAVP